MRFGPSVRLGPLRKRSFRTFLFGHFVSLVGDHIYFLALPWAAIEQDATPKVVGFLLAAAAIPRAALMLGGGVVVDRVGSRRVMLVSDGVRAGAMIAAALSAFAGFGGVAGLFVVAVVFGVVDGFFHPAVGALIPGLVDRDMLAAANGLRMLALRLAGFIGPPLSGVLLTVGGVGWAFLTNAASFAVSFVAMWSVRPSQANLNATGRAAGRFWLELTDGLRYAAGNRVLAILLAVAMLANLGFTGPANVGLPLLVQHTGWPTSAFGLLLGGLGAGATLAATLLSLGVVPRAGSGALVLIATSGQLLCTGLTPFAGGLALTVALQAGLGFTSTVAGTSMATLVQTLAPAQLLGRVNSLMYLSIVGLTPLAYALSGAVVAWFGPGALFVGGAVIQGIGLLLGLSSAGMRTAGAPSTSATEGARAAPVRDARSSAVNR